jgi:hypothetical protein
MKKRTYYILRNMLFCLLLMAWSKQGNGQNKARMSFCEKMAKIQECIDFGYDSSASYVDSASISEYFNIVDSLVSDINEFKFSHIFSHRKHHAQQEFRMSWERVKQAKEIYIKQLIIISDTNFAQHITDTTATITSEKGSWDKSDYFDHWISDVYKYNIRPRLEKMASLTFATNVFIFKQTCVSFKNQMNKGYFYERKNSCLE